MGDADVRRSPQQTQKQQQPAPDVPTAQTALVLHDYKQRYTLDHSWAVPELRSHDEVLVKTAAIGLNPIDWKAPDFNFGIPSFPYVSGRESAGTVHTSNAPSLSAGTNVLVIGTDYRDVRKAAYQEYVVASAFNVVRLPSHITHEQGSTLGVAFVTAALALGVCMGVDFSSISSGPDLYALSRSLEGSIPADVKAETLDSIDDFERAQHGDWLVIWGASATSANLSIQLARLAGLKIALVVDQAKHGAWLIDGVRPDLLVDSHDPTRAEEIIRATIGKKARFGIDTRGKESAARLVSSLSATESSRSLSPPSTPPNAAQRGLRNHIVGLTGLPKEAPEETVLHNVPIKLFHDVPEIGAALSSWLERLLEEGNVVPPRIIDVEYGFERVNGALDRMRRGEISGGKLVVRV